MKKIIVYDATGKILQAIRCPDIDAESQHALFPGSFFLDITETPNNVHLLDLVKNYQVIQGEAVKK